MTGALPGSGFVLELGSRGRWSGESSPLTPWISGHKIADDRMSGLAWPSTTAAAPHASTEQGQPSTWMVWGCVFLNGDSGAVANAQ
eukprot:363970-Chlamydomonas_euryale.AAC.13